MWSKALDTMLGAVVKKGTLQVTFPDGTKHSYGDGEGPSASIRIHDDKTMRRVAMNPELAVGEAYMDGTLTIEDDDLRSFLAVATMNVDTNRVWWQEMHLRIRTVLSRTMENNVPWLSRRNVAHHYDLTGRLYELFLDEDQQYSCAYFRDPDDDLETAQRQKKAHIAGKLLLKPGMSVLDIGCGWGGMAMTLARDYGAHVTGITLSTEQQAVARQRVADAGLSNRVKIELMDYRHLEGSFDRIVSVGMFEHVGLRHFDTYFNALRERLAPDGVALLHSIAASSRPSAGSPWILKHIFPGGYIPAVSEMVASVERSGLWLADVESWRLHYAKTLSHWLSRVEANADEIRQLYDDRFLRMWRFYLAGSEQTFLNRRQGVFQLQLSRQIDAVPITREYLYQPERKIAFSDAAE